MNTLKIGFSCFLVLASAFFLAACGKDDSTTNNTAASLAMKGTSGNAVNMNGTWTNCVFSSSDQEDERTSITLNGSSATVSISLWSAAVTANCQQTTTPDMVISGNVTATLGAEAAATWTDGAGSTLPPTGVPVGAKATAATLVFNSFTATVNSAQFISFLNGNAVCGKTDWAAGVPVDVLNCTDFISSTTDTDYWVVDDSAAVLKWYSADNATQPYQVDSINPMLK
jgi:hypothetical protein